MYPGLANDVGVSFDDDLWVIGTPKVAGGYGIYHWVNGNWVNVPGAGVRIAVGPTGPWVVNEYGNIFQFNGTSWDLKPGCAKDIGIGANGTVWVTGCGNTDGGEGIHRWNGVGWD